MANIGDTFIITIGDKMVNERSGETLYRIKGFKSLVFDEKGLEKLVPYKKSLHSDNPISVGSIVYKLDNTLRCRVYCGVVVGRNLKNNCLYVMDEFDNINTESVEMLVGTGYSLPGTDFVMERIGEQIKEFKERDNND